MHKKQTLVEKIIDMIRKRPMSLSDIIFELELDRKTKTMMLDYILKIERIAKQKGWKFIVYAAECKNCGFQFKKRIKPPSKCPRCKSQRIMEQRYYLKI